MTRHTSGICDNCNEPFEAARENARFCSAKCLSNWHYLVNRSMHEIKACAHCGAITQIRKDGNFCSKSCGSSGKNKRPGRPKLTDAEIKARQQQRNRLHQLLRSQIVIVDRATAISAELQRRSTNHRPIRTTPSIFIQANCRRCNAAFVVYGMNNQARYCSQRCSQNDTKTRHLMRKTKAFVENVSRGRVFERDNYICQLCLEPCDQRAVSNHLDEATVDHIIPLARGGEHSMTNVQTAHRRCNSAKSDRLPHEINTYAL